MNDPACRCRKDVSTVFRFAVLGLLLGSAALAQPRLWTDVDGRQVEAAYVSHNDSELVMRLADGREATVPLERLSEADRDFLEERATEENDSGEASAPEEEAGELNWDDEWPMDVKFDEDPDIEIVEESDEEDQYIYTSANYRFTCDTRLSTSLVSGFSKMFEATRLLCRTLPLAITGGAKNDGKYDILLFETQEGYIEAGGPPGSAGVFIGGRNMVMVPLTSLGVQPVGSGYMRDRKKNDTTLVHELVHQLTPRAYHQTGSRGWFTEGIAEYCAHSPYRNGRFRLHRNYDEIMEYVVRFGEDGQGGRALGEEISAPPLKKFMMMSYAEFTGPNVNFNYGFAALLATYFCEFDGDGEATRLKAFLKALRDPENRDNPDAALDALRGDRSWLELEEDIADGWSRYGVDIEFPEEDERPEEDY
jgi:hypothetical protein